MTRTERFCCSAGVASTSAIWTISQKVLIVYCLLVYFSLADYRHFLAGSLFFACARGDATRKKNDGASTAPSTTHASSRSVYTPVPLRPLRPPPKEPLESLPSGVLCGFFPSGGAERDVATGTSACATSAHASSFHPFVRVIFTTSTGTLFRVVTQQMGECKGCFVTRRFKIHYFYVVPVVAATCSW